MIYPPLISTDTARSAPPFGEGSGLGVVLQAHIIALRITPVPNTPSQGGRERAEIAARPALTAVP
jgi:hypothetical protein